MNQCVPSGDLKLSFSARSKSTNSFTTDVPSLEEYEVAELTWEKGQVATYGLGPPRVHTAADTLESIVDQATAALLHSKSKQPVPWLDSGPGPGPTAAAVDALVPCNNTIGISESTTTQVPGMGTCMVGSCTTGGGGCWPRGCKSYASASQSGDRDDSQQVTLDSCEREFAGGGLTSTSLWSPDNTSSGEDYTKTSGDDHDIIVSRTRSQRHAGERGNRKLGVGKSSVIAKSRAAAIHNQSERRRRDKINERMKTLQKLVPNSSKTDKASMLDEVIEYLKQLQAQIQMMSSYRMNMPSMMMPLPMQQHLQMSMMANMNMSMGTGMGLMDMNAIARATGVPPMMSMPATSFMPMPSWDMQPPQLTPDLLSNFFPHQSQPMTMDGYSRLAALYHQFQQSSAGCGPKN